MDEKKITNNGKVIFWGGRGHAKVLRECLSHQNIHPIAVFDNNPDTKPPFKDVPFYIGEEGFGNWIKSIRAYKSVLFIVAIGGANGEVRCFLHSRIKKRGLKPITALHPTAFVADNSYIGEGCQIFAHATVSVKAQLHSCCIINTAASVDHECTLHEGVHVAPGAHLAGEVSVGKYTMIGTGATILPRIKIGNNSVVGAGSVVTKDVPSDSIVIGNPARLK